MPNPFQVIEIEDAVESFEQGMNAGIAARLLPMNQLASARNGTLRGLYILPRPPDQKITLNYNPADSGIQQRVESGTWQACCYYKPDVGPESLLASISGRLYQFIPVGSTATVFDVTGTNPQSADAQQCWLWQSEKWVIWNDGINLPVFFDGSSTRRSLGSSISAVATSTSTIALAAAGGVTALTLVAPGYSGPFNVPIRMTAATNQVAIVQVLTAAAIVNSYQINVRTLHKVQGIDATGSVITTKPGTVGWVTTSIPSFTLSSQQVVDKVVAVSDTTNLTPLAAGTGLKIGTQQVEYRSTNSSTSMTIRCHGPSSPGPGLITYNIFAESLVTIPSNTQPNVTIGILSQNFTTPAVGSTGTMTLTGVYSGPANVVIYANATDQFLILGATSGTSGTAINVLTISGSINTTAPATTTLSNIPELPAGRMGVYGLGRNWMALTDGRQYVAGDIVGSGDSGTPGYNFTDSVLRMAENTFLAGGGAFVVPGAVGDIRALRFATQLDQSLGQGPLQIGTPFLMFSNNAPVDRTQWQSITNPIQAQALIGYGPLSHYGTISWNNDILFRARDGIRSLRLAKMEFTSWGNTPISNELRPFLATDDISLLPFESAIIFDNRQIRTFSPVNSGQGVYFTKLAIINGDPISSLRGKAQSIYDGYWDGLNVLQLVSGQFSETERAFAFQLNISGSSPVIELYEILPTGDAHFDNGTTKIVGEYEFPVMHFQARGRDPHQLIRLIDGELYADQIDGATTFEVFFRPDYDPNYHPWYSWTVDPATKANWQSRMGLGEPPTDSDASSQRPNREGYTFQLKLRVTGFARILGCRCKAVTIPDTKYAQQIQ